MSEWTSTARRRELGAALRRLRERCGISGQEMAARLQWTPSVLSRMENGKRPVTAMEVVKYTSVCGVFGAEQDALIRLADEPDDYRLKCHEGKIPDELRALMFHEQTASKIEVLEPIYLPGLLQTHDYIRALLKVNRHIDPADIDNLVLLRLARREALTRIDPAQSEFFVHENAMRMLVGSAKIMTEQMLHLLFVSGRPQCSIRVIPRSSHADGAVIGSFHIFSYRDGAPIIYVEHQTTSEFLENSKDLDAYRATLERVASVALSEPESRSFIVELASDFERQGVPTDGSAGDELAQE